MTDYTRKRLMRKYKKELAVIIGMIGVDEVSVDSVIAKTGWCRTKAFNILNTGYVLGIVRVVE